MTNISNNKSRKSNKSSSGMNIPDYQYEALARFLLPKIQKFYESKEGKADLMAYREQKAKQEQVGKK